MDPCSYYQNLYSFLSKLKSSLSSTCMSPEEAQALSQSIQSLMKLIQVQIYEYQHQPI
ncbi:MAG: hypothetical protein KBT48_10105 [Firmicutes bacterium]|nr:hypothetical protein [Bacillota bacterium]